MDEDEIMIIDENVCLLCLKQNCESNNIFTNKIDNKTIHECIEEFCNINITADSQLPENICNVCKILLEQSYLFQNQILRNYKILLDSVKIKETNGHIVIEEIKPIYENEETNIDFDTISQFSNETENKDNVEINDNEMNDTTSEVKTINQDKTKYFIDQPIIPMTSSSDDDDDDDDSDKNSDSNELELCVLPNDIVDSDLVELHLKICNEKNKIAYNDDDGNDNDNDDSRTKKAIAIENWLHKEKRYVCDVCGKAFSFKKTLKAHIERLHKSDNDKEYTKICSICNETFQSLNEYRRHVFTRKHTSKINREYCLCKCNKCDEWFKTKKELQYHRKIHFPKEFKCLECGQYFKSHSILQKHVRINHKGKTENDTNYVREKTELCTNCGKYFSPSGFVCHTKLSLKCKPKDKT